MANFDAWLNKGNTERMNIATHAVSSWNHILRNPTAITIVRGQVEQDAQMVRVEFDNTVNAEVTGEGGGKSSRRDCIVFGVKNHPNALVSDTDIRRGDRFVLDRQQYRVVQIITVPGEIQATCEVLS